MCPALRTGSSFLSTTLAHIDCQAQTLGSFGFAALANPASPTSVALTSLLTIFIALLGVRLLLGYPIAGRDVVGDIIKVGIVLTLATSWPAWRVIGYDLFINGPGEIARTIGVGAQLPGASGDLASRLQRVDDALATLNVYGTGRLGVAQGDWFQLGFARIAFLAGTLGPLALVRLLAGFLLAIAPLVAGLLLFGVTRPIFVGWARGLALTFLASMALTLLLGAQLALLEPWLQDTLRRRAANQQTLDAAVEILAVTVTFTVVSLGAFAVMSRAAFHPAAFAGTPLRSEAGNQDPRSLDLREPSARSIRAGNFSSAEGVSLAVAETLRREERLSETRRLASGGRMDGEVGIADAPLRGNQAVEALGSSYRRNTRRVSTAGARRDQSQ